MTKQTQGVRARRFRPTPTQMTNYQQASYAKRQLASQTLRDRQAPTRPPWNTRLLDWIRRLFRWRRTRRSGPQRRRSIPQRQRGGKLPAHIYAAKLQRRRQRKARRAQLQHIRRKYPND